MTKRDSQPLRCTVQNTGNQDAHRIGEYGHKIEEKVKTIQSEINENVQETNSYRTQLNSLEQKEEIKTQPEQNEETRIQKLRRS